jgi:TPR repeat protein
MAGDKTWRLSASDLNNVMIQPPRNFAGAMDLTLELRMADETVSDRRSLRFEWAAPAVAELVTPAAAMHYLDPNEIAALLKRGDDLIASGDFAAARLVLRRAAEAGDAHAAMTLAETYDPVILEKLGVHGFVPDVAMARGWYEKAKQFGSAEAPQRLEVLASKWQ